MFIKKVLCKHNNTIKYFSEISINEEEKREQVDFFSKVHVVNLISFQAYLKFIIKNIFKNILLTGMLKTDIETIHDGYLPRIAFFHNKNSHVVTPAIDERYNNPPLLFNESNEKLNKESEYLRSFIKNYFKRSRNITTE